MAVVMLLMQIFLLGILLIAVPLMVGWQFGSFSEGTSDRADGPIVKCIARILLKWISGQMLLWAGFQVICVPLILLQKNFRHVVVLFNAYGILLMILSLIVTCRSKKSKNILRVVPDGTIGHKREVWGLWIVFGLLLLFQLIQAIRLTYADWDDAFYVAISAITENADTMYQKLPYTGGTTGLDARHGLAPFPVWIAYLARMSGMRAVSVARVAVPVVLISQTYGIYYLIGNRLFRGNQEKFPLFMILTEALVLFGNYSIYSAENFMIARSRQGKAALGNIVVPMLVFLFLVLMETIQQERKMKRSYWVILFATMMTACLCSTMGSALACLLVAVTGGCIAIGYRRGRLLFPLAVCCLPGVLFLALYVWLR